MADKTARKPKEELEVEDPASYARANRARRVSEPAAAPMETDNEAGGSPDGVEPSGESPDTYVVNSGGEVRAGPGDAGRQDAPRVLDNPQDTAPRSTRPLVIGIAAGVVVLLLIYLFAV